MSKGIEVGGETIEHEISILRTMKMNQFFEDVAMRGEGRRYVVKTAFIRNVVPDVSRFVRFAVLVSGF